MGAFNPSGDLYPHRYEYSVNLYPPIDIGDLMKLFFLDMGIRYYPAGIVFTSCHLWIRLVCHGPASRSRRWRGRIGLSASRLVSCSRVRVFLCFPLLVRLQ